MVSTPMEFSAGEVPHHVEGACPNSARSSNMAKAVDIGKTVLAQYIITQQ